MVRRKFNIHLSPGMVFLVTLLFCSTIGSAYVEAEFHPLDWRYSKDILLPANLYDNEFLILVPDSAVAIKANPDFSDLRIIDEHTLTEIPYALSVSSGEVSSKHVHATITDLNHVNGRHISLVADTGFQTTLHNELQITTPSTDFLRTVKLEYSQDKDNWTTLVDGGRVYDLNIGLNRDGLRSTRIQYPTTSARFVRITILDDDGDAFDIGNVDFFFVRDVPAEYVSYASEIISEIQLEESNTTQFLIDLGYAGLPSTRFKLSVASVNYHRDVIVEKSEDSSEWDTVEEADYFFHYRTKKFELSKLVIDYPEVSSRYLRLTVRNGDSPPLDFEGIDVLGFRRAAIFEAMTDASYHLYYGSPTANDVVYDLSKILPYLSVENLRHPDLGDEKTNKNFRGRSAEPFTDRYPGLMPTIVVLAVAVLGTFLFLISRRSERSYPAD